MLKQLQAFHRALFGWTGLPYGGRRRSARQRARHTIRPAVGAVEPLEQRLLLNSDAQISAVGQPETLPNELLVGEAPASHVFAQFDGVLADPSSKARVDISITPRDFSLAGRKTMLGFHVLSAEGGDLDPAAVRISTAGGPPVRTTLARADLGGHSQSLVLAPLQFGNYRVTVRGQRGTFGAFRLDVYLVGDADGDHHVSRGDTRLVRALLGVGADDPNYRVEADADLSGRISRRDLEYADANRSDTTKVRPLGLELLIAPESTHQADGSLVTNLTQVSLTGMTNPGASLSLDTEGDEQFDEGTAKADAAGSFSFDVTLHTGLNSLGVRATDRFGQHRIETVRITQETVPPVETDPPVISAALADDTGGNATDALTSNHAISGKVTDASRVTSLRARLDGTPPASFFDIFANLRPDGGFQLSRSRIQEINGGPLAEGGHTLHLQAADEHGNVSGLLDLTFTLDTTPPLAPTFDLAPASDSGVPGDHQTNAARVALAGQTDPLALLTLLENGMTTSATAAGTFEFLGVLLTSGGNRLRIRAMDLAGNTSEFSQTITRVDDVRQTDVVLTWNQVALEAVRLDATPPPSASRGLAMVSLAVYDAINAIEGTPAYAVALAAPAGASPGAAVAAAAHGVLSYLYPAQQTYFDAALTNSMAQISNGQSKAAGIAVGQAAADAILALRVHDGWDQFVDYVPGGDAGSWEPTAPMFADALLPQWATLEPFAMMSPDQFRPAGPPDLTSQAWADSFNDVKSLGRADSSTRTAEQTLIARFWADGAGSYTPPGHWNQIAGQVAEAAGNTLAQDARLFAELNITLADAAIVAWNAKYNYNTWRPITAIRAAEAAGNDQVQADPAWSPLLITPPFPEYVSGHSTFSGGAATVLDSFFGSSVRFSTTSLTLPGVTRAFASFDDAAAEAGRSRIYGGIHFEFANQDGLAAGRALAEYVLDTFSTATDTRPPQIRLTTPAVEATTSTNFTVQGQVLDNLSGVASLEVQLDDRAFADVAFDAMGNFSVPTTLPLDGSADGSHVLRFQATDARDNISPPVELAFTLDTRAPQITLTSPGAGDIAAGARLTGTANGTGSAITRLGYRLDDGTTLPIAFDRETGRFDQPLELSRASAGPHTLVLTARDGAGHETIATVAVNLTALIPFTVTRFTPLDGARDVGATFRPQVFFARPVDTASLSADNFFASGPTGAKLPARIVAANDGSFAWLFFTGSMPGASLITVHIDGATIRATADGAALDANGDGAAGGELRWAFTTVSLTPLPGTSLSGKVVDPGPDLKPMTFDDVRVGPDGVLHTADDVFLLPLAGVKVFLVGLEDSAVFTDAGGNFRFDAVPAGDVKLATDGRTATNAPAEYYFPEMVMDLNVQVGQANMVMGTMGSREERLANRDRQEVYLPRLSRSILHEVSLTEPTRVGVTAVSAPSLTPEQRVLFALDVPAGSLLDKDGNPMATGQVGISTVPPELVRDMLPEGLLQPPTGIPFLTVQAPGVSKFATPVPLTFPNVYNAAPGSQLNFLSFDHTTGRLEIEGTATVSADGLSVRTDPGTGIIHPGWHEFTPPGGPAGPTPNGPPPPARTRSSQAETRVFHAPVALPLITGETGTLSDQGLVFTAPAAGMAKSLTVKIEIDGPLATFMKKTISFSPNVKNLPFVSNTITLMAGSGQTRTLDGTAKTYTELFGPKGFAALDRDVLYGAKIQATTTILNIDGSLEIDIRSFFLYRFVNTTQPDEAKLHTGSTAVFPKTLADGTFGVSSIKVLAGNLPKGFTTTFQSSVPGDDNPFLLGTGAKNTDPIVWEFDPIQVGSVAGEFTIIAVNNDLGRNIRNVPVGTIGAVGTGAAKFKINLNLDGLAAELVRVVDSLQLAWTPGPDNFPGFRDGIARDATPADEVFYGFVKPGPDGRLGTGDDIPSDDRQEVVYVLGDASNDPKVVHTVQTFLANGSTIPRDVLSFARNAAWATHAGNDNILGNADDAKYARFKVASERFKEEFRNFLPDKRPLDTNEHFKLEERALQVALKLKKVVMEIYGPVLGATGAIEFVDDGAAGGDRTVTWEDAFVTANNGRSKGPGGTGDPVLAFMEPSNDRVAMRPILGDRALPLAAKIWQLAEKLNVQRTRKGSFSIGLNIDFTNPTVDYAAYVAGTVAHEMGHSFGLIDAYVDDGMFPGTAMCKPVFQGSRLGICIPNDIMRPGSPNDGALRFALGNQILLKASLGLGGWAKVEGMKISYPLKPGLIQYQQTFNLGVAGSSTGLPADTRDDFSVPFGQTVPTLPTNPQVALRTGDQEFFGGPDEAAVDLGPVVADGPSDAAGIVTFQVENVGYGPLTVSNVHFARGDQGFSLIDAATLFGIPIPEGETRTLTLRFDPSVAGTALDTLIVTSDADAAPMLSVSLIAGAFTKSPFAQVEAIGNNNLGGVVVESGLASLPEIFRLTNAGLDPLQISGFVLPEGNGAFRLLGVPAELDKNPLTLAHGESFTFGARFDPDRLGLARALIEVHSNDPAHPTLRLAVAGTGLGPVAEARWGNDYVALDTPDIAGAPPLRARSDDKGNFEFFLLPSTSYEFSVFDPDTGLVGLETGKTTSSGQRTDLATTLVFQASSAPDTDYDGLPDDIEHAIGTSPTRTDSDGNGIDDFDEVRQGLDPLGGRAFPTGVVAQVPLLGEVKQVIVEGATQTTSAEIAYLATGSYGLAVVDVSRFSAPVVLAQLKLPGDATDVAYDPELRLAVVAGGAGGLHIVDVSDPRAPRLVRTIDAPAAQVEVKDRLAYVGVGPTVRAYDVQQGLLLDQLYVGSDVTGMAREGTFLYLVQQNNRFTTVDIGAASLQRRGMIGLAGQATYTGPLFVGGGTAYVVNTQNGLASLGSNGGFATVDVSNPDIPRLISSPDHPPGVQEPDGAVAANGSGLALLVGNPLVSLAGDRSPRLELLDVSDLRETYQLLLSMPLPSLPNSVVTAAGAAFVADGTGGLVVVSYLPFDVGGRAPTVSASLVLPTVSERGPGAGFAIEQTPVQVKLDVRDDVQVRSVELLVNDDLRFSDSYQVVRTDVSFPFDFSFLAPPNRPGVDGNGRLVGAQLRVTDTGGNVKLSDVLRFEAVADGSPPIYFRRDFVDGSVRSRGLSDISLVFSKPLARAGVNDQTFQVLDAQDHVVAGYSVRIGGADRIALLHFDGLPLGAYRLVIDAAHITDRSNQPLGNGFDVTRFQVVEPTSISWVGARGGNWSDPQQWSTGRLPGPSDSVDIVLAEGETLRYEAGTTVVRSLQMTGGALNLVGGILSVSEPSQVDSLRIATGTASRGVFLGSGSLTIASSLVLDGGVLAGTGDTLIAAGAAGDLHAGVLDSRPITVAGLLKGTGKVDYFRAPVLTIQPSGRFEAKNGFKLTGQDGETGRLDLFGTFTTDAGASVVFGPEFVVLPGGAFESQPGRLEFQGGGSFGGSLVMDPDATFVLRGPPGLIGIAAAPPPLYVLPVGSTVRLDGSVLVGGARVIVSGDTHVHAIDFTIDNIVSGPGTVLPREANLVVDGTLTVEHTFAANSGGGKIEGTGEIVIAPGAICSPRGQVFRGVTVRILGELLMSGGFRIGSGSIFELQGTWSGLAVGDGSFFYGAISDGSGAPNTPDDSLDRGLFNARIPLTFIGGSANIGATFHSFAGIELRNVQTRFNLDKPYLEFTGGATLDGPVTLDAGTSLRLLQPTWGGSDPRIFANVYRIGAAGGIHGPGEVRLLHSSLILNQDIDLARFRFATQTYNILGGGGTGGSVPNTISGPGNITVSEDFDWGSGPITGPGRVTVLPSASLEITESQEAPFLDGATLLNQGSGMVGDIRLGHGALFRNEGNITLENVRAATGGGRIENAGTVLIPSAAGFGPRTIGAPLINTGLLRIDPVGGGLTDRLTFASLDNAGRLSIAAQSRLLQLEVLGDFVQRDSGTFHIEISIIPSGAGLPRSGGTTVDGRATLAGTLEVQYVLIPPNASPDRPRVGDAFQVLTFASHTGDFATFVDLEPGDGIGFDRVFGPTSLRLLAQATP